MAAPQLVVMAAGIGSRYGGLKQVDPVGPAGEIILDYSVYDAIRAGFEKVVFIIRPDIEEIFREQVGSKIEGQIDVEYVFQTLDALPEGFAPPAGRTKPWGTGHALLCAAKAISGPFAVINADDFYGRGGFRAIGEFLRTVRPGPPELYAMVGYILENTLTDHGYVSRGICRLDTDNSLSEIVERTRIEKFEHGVRFSEDGGESWQEIDPHHIVSMNLWGFTPSFLDHLSEGFTAFLRENLHAPTAEYYIPTCVNRLLDEGKASVTVLPCEEQWLGVTYQEDKPHVVETISRKTQAREYPASLWG